MTREHISIHHKRRHNVAEYMLHVLDYPLGHGRERFSLIYDMSQSPRTGPPARIMSAKTVVISEA
ncbi:hypothetical protein IF1G_06517 [Cordyceps javanica]|uniref:Uncharacterized protein n=1 Tax=Cordyceps javanica TaxID=43265 RepID=A0A545UYH8_9HYPO|nr:hypothetical protein IF1G_06517 [Cordyceps javanica]